jgi:phage tail sheath protein FI
MTTYGRPGVYITERLLPAPIAAEGTAEAAGAVLSQFAQGPETPTIVTSWYEFVKRFGGYNSAYPGTFSVASFFQNGGSELVVKRVLAEDAEPAAVNVPQASGSATTVAVVTSLSRGADANNLRVQLTAAAQTNYYNLTVYREQVSGTASNVANDAILERFTNVVFNNPDSSDFIDTVVNGNSEFIRIVVESTTVAPSTAVLPLTGGDDGEAPEAADYVGAVSDFSELSRPLVVFVPDAVPLLGATNGATAVNGAVAWAEDNASFVVADSLPSQTASEVKTFAGTLTASSHVAVYYPNIFVGDPLGRSPQALRKIGPAGAVAGLYIATDKLYGPFKAPAGIRATIRGAVAVEKTLTSAELDSLNTGASPVNALRNLPGAGVVSMGARTLQQDGTANKYVNMRRSLNYITKQLESLTEFALFENNDEQLWSRIRSNIAVFLGEYRNQGGLRGATEAQAFFVKVDSENNPQASIEQGEVHIEVGVALQYPAEFVVINLSQKTAA